MLNLKYKIKEARFYEYLRHEVNKKKKNIQIFFETSIL